MESLASAIQYGHLFTEIISLFVCLWLVAVSKHLDRNFNGRRWILIGIFVILFYRAGIFGAAFIASLFTFEAFVEFDRIARLFPVVDIVGVIILTIGITKFVTSLKIRKPGAGL